MFRYTYELPEIGTDKLTNKSISNVGQEITVFSSVFYDRKFSKVVFNRKLEHVSIIRLSLRL